MKTHPIDLMIVAAIVSLEALIKASVYIVAFILTIANWQPKSAPKSTPVRQPPFVHPLYAIGEQLESLTVKTLRLTIGTKSRQSKHKLVSAYLSV